MWIICSGAMALVLKVDKRICNNGMFGEVSVSELQLKLQLFKGSIICICRKFNWMCLVYWYRITESPRLEKTSKITQSNHSPPTSISPLSHIPLCICISTFLEHLQGWWLHHLHGQPIPVPDHSFKEENSPNVYMCVYIYVCVCVFLIYCCLTLPGFCCR